MRILPGKYGAANVNDKLLIWGLIRSTDAAHEHFMDLVAPFAGLKLG